MTASRRSRRPLVQRLEARQLLAGDTVLPIDRPLGATQNDTGEFFLGRVAVTPVFLNSDGSIDPKTQNWTPGEIDGVMANIAEGLQWWRDTLVNTQLDADQPPLLEFVIDDTYALDPVEIPHEPIVNSSDMYTTHALNFLNAIDAELGSDLNESMFAFNDRQRQAHQADWSFTIFVADSSDGSGFFPNTGTFRGAFALAGGLYIVMPSTRPVQTIAHEAGHIFWAFDEYAGGDSYDRSRGYYDISNSNAAFNPTRSGPQLDSIMAGGQQYDNAFASNTSAAATLEVIGWRDSDGDGIFDVLDVPLNLTGQGHFDAPTSTYVFNGRAAAGTLINRNGEGFESDITINRIRRFQVSIDDGDWIDLATPNTYVADLAATVDVPGDFATIRFRVIDDVTGVTSEPLTGTPTVPVTPNVTLTGFAYLDDDVDGTRDAGEALLDSIIVAIRDDAGQALFSGDFDVADAELDRDLLPVDGMTFRGDGVGLSDSVQVAISGGNGSRRLIQVFNETLNFASTRLSKAAALRVDFAQTVGHVEVDVVGLGDLAYGRVEAYDAAGNLIDRVTTDLRNDADGFLSRNETQTLTLIDPSATIASVRVFGHANSWIGVSGVRHGVAATQTTAADGVIAWNGLPDGDYQILATPQRVIHAFDPVSVTLAGGQIVGGIANLAARRVDSIRYNAAMPEDVNGDGLIRAVDALQVINDINAFGARFLTFDDVAGSAVDVNNDGRVTAVDALRVINKLNELDTGNSNGGGNGGSPASGEPLFLASGRSLAADDTTPTSSSPSSSIAPAPRIARDAVFADSRQSWLPETFRREEKWIGGEASRDQDGVRFV